MNLDDLVTRLYRTAASFADPGWAELLKNAALSLAAAHRSHGLLKAIALTDTVLVLAEHGHQLDRAATQSLRQGLRDLLDGPAPSAGA